ncbi:CPBP family intramembrane glutamic endopeptidase [Aridibaculum aurantiacum]|uniref:CPBP family intramembrane glutamic endopeptidase n=1 Tax=Aridibaculum aurantiacum TaxID=2810307 RepID=UPI001A95A345|nr:type II CAAX endopeptidase family protein [Aridibaculum aurantiacum]
MQAPLIKQGWLRVIIYFILLMLVAFSVSFLASEYISTLIEDNDTKFFISYILVAASFIGLTVLAKKHIDRQPLSTLGLEWKKHKEDGAMGLFTSTTLLAIGTIVLLVTHQLVYTGVGTDFTGLFIQLGLMLMVSFSEEIVFRGYILYNLMESANKYTALIISAVLFAVVHASNPNAGILPIVNVFLAGVLLGINFIFTRNLAFAIMLHLGWNFMQGAILGYEVSGIDTPNLLQQYISGNDLWTGGEFGFEGSLLCTVLLVMAVAIWWYLFSLKYKTVKKAA